MGHRIDRMAMLTTLSPQDLIPVDHPIRRIGRVVDAVLAELDGEYSAMYATTGRRRSSPTTVSVMRFAR